MAENYKELASAIASAVKDSLKESKKAKEVSAATLCYEMMRDAPVGVVFDEYSEPFFVLPDYWVSNYDANDANDASSKLTLIGSCEEGTPYNRVSIVTNVSSVILRYPVSIKSQILYRILSRRFFDTYGKTIGDASIKQAIQTHAGGSAKSQLFYNRVGVDKDGDWWIDMGDARYILVTDDGWSIQNKTSVCFRHYSHQSVMPTPKHGKGDVLNLLDFINLPDVDSQLLHLVWSIETLIPGIIQCVEYLYGGRGTVKTSGQLSVKQIFDPSVAGAITLPSDANNLNQNLDHHRIPVFDNIGYITQEQSDTLCRGVTGLGYQKRALYTDDEDVTRYFRRCIALNGINPVVDQGDLSQRMIMLETNPLPESLRKTDQEVQAQLNAYAPGILADALDLLVKARQLIKQGFTVKNLPRMADFVYWGCAITSALGLDYEKFMAAYQLNQRDAEQSIVRNNLIGGLLMDYMGNFKDDKKFPAQELYTALKIRASDSGVDVRRDYPGNVRWFTDTLRKIGPSFPSVGFSLRVKKEAEGAMVYVSRLQSTTLDGASEKQVSSLKQNNWGFDNLKDYRVHRVKKPESPVESVTEKKESISYDFAAQAVLKYGPLVKGERVKLEDLQGMLGGMGLDSSMATKVISSLYRDGKIFYPSPGFVLRGGQND